MIPRIAHSFPTIAFVLAWMALRTASGSVVINEIMYQPPGFPENPLAEYIELYNTAPFDADISGWQFTKGISFIFPAGTVIPPNGYLVVAANIGTFQTAHPGVPNVVGDWTGSLSNVSEELKLVNAAGATQDAVEYASEGDWAVRGRELAFNGWEWQTLAAGGGRSLELRHSAMDHNNGQNWGESQISGGTPGAANTLASTNIPPLISNMKHFPAVPRSSDPVTISCDVADEDTLATATVTLFWRNATTPSPGSFQSVAMTHDGAGTFFATLPAMANLTIIEFYVQASDGTLTRTWPAPTTEGQNANCQYQVDNEALNATDSYYRLILTAAENGAFDNVNNGSNRQFNLTLVVTRGADTTIRYRSSMRIRGNSSRSYMFRPLRISIPNDDRWGDVRSFNLNPKASFLQYLGMKMFQLAGVRSTDSIPLELRRNGVESTTNGGSTPDYGKWVRLEETNGDFVNNHWPEADGGNLYKKVDSSGGGDRYWRSTQPAPTIPDGMIDGWTKQNNSAANDWSDLTTFFQKWQTSAAPHFPGAPAGDVASSNGGRLEGSGLWNGTAFNAAEVASIETVSDLDQWARWFAVMTIIQDLETKISNGVDDDYFAYFAPAAGGQRKMQILAHDLDTIFGLGDNPRSFNYVGLYDATEAGQGTTLGFAFRTLLPLFGTTGSAGYAPFRTKYFTAIRELYGTVFDANTQGGAVPNPPLYSFLDNHLAGWVPTATLAAMKTFASARQSYLLGLIGSGAITPPPPTSTATLTSAPGQLMISEVLANNIAAVNVGGAFPDIIELYNAGASPANLAGRSITDDPAVPAKYVFPAGTTIAAGNYLVLYADSTAGAGHLPFSLNNGGEGVYLFESAANGGASIDSIVFGVQAPDYSIGRTGAARDIWALCTPTPGGINTAVASLAAPASVSINEWLANPDYQFDNDFVELYNAAAQPVALGGMSITDDFINYPTRAVFPQLSFMAAGAFLRLDAKGGNATAGVATELPFNLDSTAGWIALIGQNGTVVDRVDVISHPADTSTGRSPNGGATWAHFGLPTGLATPGASNVATPANILALMNGLRITELLYSPTNLEYIELQNLGPVMLDLSGVRFVSGITYTFPAGTMLASGAFVVVCRDRTAFQMQFGGAVPLAPGNFTGSLDNDGEVIAFRPPAPYDANILRFAYDATWYPGTSTGYALTVVNAIGTAPRDWGDRDTWSASTVLGGTPGNDGPPVITSALNVGGVIGESFQYQIVATKFSQSYSASPLPPGLNFNSNTGLIDGTPTAAGMFNVTIGATNAGGTTYAQLVINVTVASFAWNNISSPQQAGAPSAVTIAARDAQGQTVTSFNGAANLSGTMSGGGSGATVVITECRIATTDSWELQNVSSATVNSAGWFVVMNNPGGINTVYNPISLPASLAAGEIFYRHEDSADLPHYFGFSISWGAGGPGWVMLVDGTGRIRDFFAWGYTAADISNINVTVTGFTLNPVAQGAWSGAGETISSSLGDSQALLRTGTDDHNGESDWSIGGASSTLGVQNTGLTLPFPPDFVSVPVTPTSVPFSNGIFSGNVQIGTVGANIRITVDDGFGHTGISNAFNTVAPPAPIITSPTSALAAVGQPFSYQIVATNFPGSYNATNLPNELIVNTLTGLVSGIPTAAGTRSILLSATNPGGNDTATLFLQVQTDADGDGMGDAWETAHGLDPSFAGDAVLDKDGDGQSNHNEWLAGTVPNNSSSRLNISSEERLGPDVRLTWASVPGKRYRIVSRMELLSGAWTDLTPIPIVATAASTQWTHAGGSSGVSRFYRVEIVP